MAVLATVQAPGGDLLVAATHLSFLPGWNVVQLRRVRRVIQAHAGAVVLMGDLTMESPLARRVTGLRSLVDAVTFPVEKPERQIDHILGRGVVTAGDGEAVRLSVSDHRALVVELADLGR